MLPSLSVGCNIQYAIKIDNCNDITTDSIARLKVAVMSQPYIDFHLYIASLFYHVKSSIFQSPQKMRIQRFRILMKVLKMSQDSCFLLRFTNFLYHLYRGRFKIPNLGSEEGLHVLMTLTTSP